MKNWLITKWERDLRPMKTVRLILWPLWWYDAHVGRFQFKVIDGKLYSRRSRIIR